MTLEVDRYGNVRRSVAIGYGRMSGQSQLQGDDKKKQEQKFITYTENGVTKDVTGKDTVDEDDVYRTPLPCESRTFELTGLSPENCGKRFSFDELTKDGFNMILSLPEVPYHQPVDNAAQGKRLIEHVRTVYRRNDLAGPLPLGTFESLALSHESLQLAFIPDVGVASIHFTKARRV